MTTRSAGTSRAEAFPRRLSSTAVRGGGIAAMLWRQIAAEFWKQWRLPIFSISTIALPVFFFVIFGLPNAGIELPDGTTVGRFVMASMSAYGLLGIAFFSFGVGVAVERGQGWMKLLKATPMPAWVYFAARMVMAVVFALIICLLLFPVAIIFAGVRLSIGQWLGLIVTLLLGMLPFTTIGFAIGYWAGPNSAVPVAQFGYFLLAFASGLWIPLDQLPGFVQSIAPYLPTYHYAQLAWGAVGADDGQFTIHVLWLLGTALVFGALAVWGYRRDQGRQYG